MKVLILINSFGRGGAEKSTALFVLKLNEQYEDLNFVCVYLHPYMPGFYKEIEERGIPLIHIKEKIFFARIRRFKNIMNEFKPDIVHSVLYESNMIKRFSSIGQKAIFVESLVNKPYFIDREYQSKNVKYKSSIIKLIDKSTSFLVDHFHSVGYAVANHYIEVYNRPFNYTVVERGRPEPINIPVKVKLDPEKLVLVTLARQEYQKGLIYMLEAVLPLKEKIKLKIVGREGAATSSLKEFVRIHGMENTVEFCGYLNDITSAVMEADIYISASLYEGLPGSVIEAMSLKMPLILSDIEEHREVAVENENALFFTSKNPQGLTDKIEFFINNPNLLQDYGNNSFEIFKKRFTEDAMVKGMAKFYQSLIP